MTSNYGCHRRHQRVAHPRIVVYPGDGFNTNMIAYLHSTGKVVELPDLDTWLKLYFGL